MTARPRILYVCPAWPHDQAHGGQLRALHLGRALQSIGDVQLAVIDGEPTAPDAVTRTAAEFDVLEEFHSGLPRRRVRDRLDWALNPRCRNVHGTRISAADQQRFAAHAARADLVWFLKLRTANSLPHWRWPRSVMDLDDVPSLYARAARRSSPTLAGRLQATVHGWIYRRRERLLLERFTVLAVCSEDDRAHLGFRDRVHVIPNGFARPARDPQPQPASPPRLGFMGLYRYGPNYDGVRWFVEHCWPEVKRQVPGIRLRLVGADTDGPLRPRDPAIDGLGWLPDPAAEIATWSAMIVPIRSGAGTRIKIPAAFSRRCPVVSTSFGAYGYAVEPDRHLLLADAPSAFARACVHLARCPAAGRLLAANAWDTFLQRWTWDAIARQVAATAEDGLRRTASPTA